MAEKYECLNCGFRWSTNDTNCPRCDTTNWDAFEEVSVSDEE